jgi:DNA primase
LKYLIKAKIEVDGIVDKHDVIGAIFGQTEGLLGPDFDLRELQDKGKIGRIVIELKPTENNKMKGELVIPSNLDRVETAFLAAMIETVDKVGPYNARILTQKIVDLRLEKLKKAIERAKEILRMWQQTEVPDPRELLQEIEKALKPPSIIEYGPEKLPAGPDLEISDTLIIVEGRADVLNLLRYGITNTIALEGAQTEIPETIKKLAQTKKKVILFLDGDRGGDLILEMVLKSGLPVHYLARAPPGKEVEDLTGKEVKKALSKLTPLTPAMPSKPLAEVTVEAKPEAQPIIEIKPVEKPPEVTTLNIPTSIMETTKQLAGTLEAYLYDANWNLIKKVAVRELYDTLQSLQDSNVKFIVFDGIITQRIYDVATEKGISLLVGARIGNISKKEGGPILLTFYELSS